MVFTLENHFFGFHTQPHLTLTHSHSGVVKSSKQQFRLAQQCWYNMSEWVSILDAQSHFWTFLVQLSDLPMVSWEVCCNTRIRVFHTQA